MAPTLLLHISSWNVCATNKQIEETDRTTRGQNFIPRVFRPINHCSVFCSLFRQFGYSALLIFSVNTRKTLYSTNIKQIISMCAGKRNYWMKCCCWNFVLLCDIRCSLYIFWTNAKHRLRRTNRLKFSLEMLKKRNLLPRIVWRNLFPLFISLSSNTNYVMGKPTSADRGCEQLGMETGTRL